MKLTINGVDILPYVMQSGYKWQRQDVDGEEAGRTMDATMHRDRVATKDRLDISCIPLTSEEARKVLNAIYPEFVTVTYTSPREGEVTRQMYSNNNPAVYCDTVTDMWTGISFPLIER